MKLYRIRRSKIDKKGRGLYATRDIKEGTKIINYVGKILTNKEVDESIKFDNKKPIYLFTLNKKFTLDGDFSWNIAGLVNHSCNNNCDYNGKGLKEWITAIRDIKKGEQFGNQVKKVQIHQLKDHIAAIEHFDNVPLKTVLAELSAIFSIDIQFDDTNPLFEEGFSGTINSNDLDLSLNIVMRPFELNYEKTQQSIIVLPN